MKYADALSGYVGGASGILFTHPLDTIRVRMQVFSQQSTYNNNLIHVLKELFKTRGILGLYAGVIPPVFLRGFGFGINRFVYGKMAKSNSNIVTGLVAGFFNGVADLPIFLVKSRVQVLNSEFKENLYNYYKMSIQVYKNEGVLAFFRGLTFMTFVSSGGYALFYVFYDNLRQKEYNPYFSGMFAAVACWPVFYPFDVLRTRQQTCLQQLKAWYHFRELIVEQPPKKWFPGLSFTLVRTAPRYGVAMFVCERTKQALAD